MATFAAIPNELLEIIAKHLPKTKQLLNFALTEKRAVNVLDSEVVWQELCERLLNVTDVTMRQHAGVSYKQFFKESVEAQCHVILVEFGTDPLNPVATDLIFEEKYSPFCDGLPDVKSVESENERAAILRDIEGGLWFAEAGVEWEAPILFPDVTNTSPEERKKMAKKKKQKMVRAGMMRKVPELFGDLPIILGEDNYIYQYNVEDGEFDPDDNFVFAQKTLSAIAATARNKLYIADNEAFMLDGSFCPLGVTDPKKLYATDESFGIIDGVGDIRVFYQNIELQVVHWECHGDPFIQMAMGHDDACFALHASGKLVEITGRTELEVWPGKKFIDISASIDKLMAVSDDNKLWMASFPFFMDKQMGKQAAICQSPITAIGADRIVRHVVCGRYSGLVFTARNPALPRLGNKA